MNSSLSVDRLCCLHEELTKLSNVESVRHLVETTARCFHELNVSETLHVSTILQVYGIKNSTYTYNTNNCAINEAQLNCSKPTQITSMVYIVFWVIILFLTLVFNLTVTYAIFTINLLRNHVTNLLISSLAIADFFVAVVIIPVKIKFAFNNMRWCSSVAMCRIYLTADNTFFSASITSLFVVTIDRYMALMLPYRYPNLMTMGRGRAAIIGVWAYGILWGLLGNVKWEDVKAQPIVIANQQCLMINKAYQITSLLLVFYVPVVIMGFIYLKILTLATQHARSIARNTFSTPSDPQPKKTMVSRRSTACCARVTSVRPGCRRMVLKATKTVATIYGTFVFCWMPVTAFTLVFSLCPHWFDDRDWTWFYVMFVEVLPVLNSLVNPCIYAFMNTQYRRAFCEVFRRERTIKKTGKFDRRLTVTASTYV